MSARKTCRYAVDKIRQWEGLRLNAYKDSAGVLTIGYGHTGPDVKVGMVITEDEAEDLLRSDLLRFERAVNNGVQVPLSDNQFGALVSFAFNVGVTAFNNSTLLRKLNKGDYDAVPGELARWNKITVNGKKTVLKGLANRRAAEAGLWATGGFVSSAPIRATVNGRTLLSGETVATAGAIISSLATASAGPGPMQWAFAVVLVGAAIAAGVFLYKKSRE